MTRQAFVNRPIRQPDRSGTRDALRIMGFAALLAAPVLGYVALASVHQLATEYRASRLVEKIRSLEKRRDRLALQRAGLVSLPRVEAAARESLGMVPEAPAEPRSDLPLEAVRPGKAPAAPGAAPPPTGGPR